MGSEGLCAAYHLVHSLIPLSSGQADFPVEVLLPVKVNLVNILILIRIFNKK